MALGKTAKDKEWFKTCEGGHALGRLVAKHLSSMAATDTHAIVEALRRFIHDG
ncbi:MAG: hypothetical protein U1F43_32420 [Myxococcota bacterium]